MRKQSLFEDCLLHRTTVFSRFSSFSFLRFVFFFSLRSDFFFFSLHHHLFLFSVSSVLQQLKKQCKKNSNRLQTEQLVKLSCHSVIFCTTFDQHFPFLKRPLYIFPSLYIPSRCLTLLFRCPCRNGSLQHQRRLSPPTPLLLLREQRQASALGLSRLSTKSARFSSASASLQIPSV